MVGLELRDLFLAMRTCWGLGVSGGSLLKYCDCVRKTGIMRHVWQRTLGFILIEFIQSSSELEAAELPTLGLTIVLEEGGSESRLCG